MSSPRHRRRRTLCHWDSMASRSLGAGLAPCRPTPRRRTRQLSSMFSRLHCPFTALVRLRSRLPPIRAAAWTTSDGRSKKSMWRHAPHHHVQQQQQRMAPMTSCGLAPLRGPCPSRSSAPSLMATSPPLRGPHHPRQVQRPREAGTPERRARSAAHLRHLRHLRLRHRGHARVPQASVVVQSAAADASATMVAAARAQAEEAQTAPRAAKQVSRHWAQLSRLARLPRPLAHRPRR